MTKHLGFYIGVAGLAALAVPAQAAENTMKACGAKYQAAKAAGSLPAGQTWTQYLAQCRAAMAPASATSAASATARPAAAPKAPSRQSAAMVAMRAREKECGQQWSAAKAAGKVPAGQTWPKYWSACNARLKS